MPAGRPKIQNHSKYRRWKVVIHDVSETCLSRAQALTLKFGTTRQVISVEPTPDIDNNFHLHFYGQWKNQKHFNQLLKDFQRISTHISSDPSNPGRVQLDTWSTGQTWDNVTQYLVSPIKNKVTGEVKTNKKADFNSHAVHMNTISKMYQAELIKNLSIQMWNSIYDLGLMPTNSPTGIRDEIEEYKFLQARPRVKPKILFPVLTI